MKKNFNYLLLITMFAILVSSCTKEDEIEVNPSFDQYVKANSNLTMFAAAVDKAGLKDFTSGPGPFTWFAPTNAGFAAAGITTDSLNKLSPSALSYLLTYHLVNANYRSIDMIAVSSISRTTQMGGAVFSGSFNNNYYVNGAQISTVDAKLNNGTIHVVERFLTPPQLRGNIISILNSTGQHTLLIAALTRAGLNTTLASTSVFTVMAPTDAAMTAAGLTATAIAATPVATLAARLRYHYFLNTRLFTNDFAADLNTISTAAGASTSLTTSENGTKIKGKNNPSFFNITRSDILGTNGVVHVIDGVLTP